MRLTHHHYPTRSVIILVIIVLATVYTAFTLLALQQKQLSLKSFDAPKIASTRLNTDDWQTYIDRTYPLDLLVPKDWKVVPDDSYSGFYVVNFETRNQGTVKVFISDTQFAGIKTEDGLTFKTNEGIEVTKYDEWLYTAKVDNYYYTFDATLGIDLQKELAEIVRLARFH